MTKAEGVSICSVFCFFFFVCFVFLQSLVAEPSAFELQSGATKKELKNLQNTNKNLENIAIDYNTRIQVLEQSQEGLQSIIEGQSLRIKQLLDLSNGQETRIKTLESNLDFANNVISELKEQVKTLTHKLEEASALNAKAHSEILKKLESLEKNPNTAGQKANEGKKSEAKTSPTKSSNADKNTDKPEQKLADRNNKIEKSNSASEFPKEFKNLPKQEVYEQAQKLYKQKNFDEASVRYKWLAESEYKAGFCYYILGEIAYKQAKYQEAIVYFKRSVAKDDKASYMPVILWHTAWAFKYTKDLENYEKFLDFLIASYPDSEQGKKAKNLKKTNTTKKDTK